MKIYNLTGKQVTVKLPSGERRTFQPEKFQATTRQDEAVWYETAGMPTVKLSWNVTGLPSPQKGTIYIVTPAVVCTALLSGRTVNDLRAPSNAVPGEEGVYEKLVMA